jgi:hypothetical protein
MDSFIFTNEDFIKQYIIMYDSSQQIFNTILNEVEKKISTLLLLQEQSKYNKNMIDMKVIFQIFEIISQLNNKINNEGNHFLLQIQYLRNNNFLKPINYELTKDLDEIIEIINKNKKRIEKNFYDYSQLVNSIK